MSVKTAIYLSPHKKKIKHVMSYKEKKVQKENMKSSVNIYCFQLTFKIYHCLCGSYKKTICLNSLAPRLSVNYYDMFQTRHSLGSVINVIMPFLRKLGSSSYK